MAAKAPSFKVPGFNDIGKDTAELLYGGRTGLFQYDKKLKISTKTDDGMNFTLNTAMKGDNISGSFRGSYETAQKVKVDVDVDSSSKVGLTATIPEVTKGLKATVSGSIPNLHTSGKLALEYVLPNTLIKSTVGLQATPVIDLALTTGQQGVVLGALASYETATSSLKAWSVGATYLGKSYAAGAILSDKGNKVKAHYVHTIAAGRKAGLEVVRTLSTQDTTFTVGYSQQLAGNTLAKVKLDNSGVAGVLFEKQLDASTKATVSGQFNASNLSLPAKVGFAFEVNN